MIPRTLQLPDDESFFLFGPRGCGKTTLIKELDFYTHSIYINLLLDKHERRFSNNPDDLISIVNGCDDSITHIIIDEVQKIPKLLDVVHELIESTDKKFVLTGSSARKLKAGGANLLAGRAFVYNLHPYSFLEIKNQFDLLGALQYGMLPKIFTYDPAEKKQQFLESYTNTYLKEEIWTEQVIKELEPFRHFLEVAAQCNGKIVNFSNIARDVGVSDRTVLNYYSILEDTLLGFFLRPFQHSFRKRLSKTPKFYFFDTGIVRVLNNQIDLPLTKSTFTYGDTFEHFIILQCKNLASYYHRHYKFSFLKTKDDAEIDIVIERPGKETLFIEIKSSDNVNEQHLSTLKQLQQDFGDCEAVCFSQDPYRKKLGDITVYPWQDGISHFFT